MFFPTSTHCCLKAQCCAGFKPQPCCAGLKPQPCCAARSRPVPPSSPQRVPRAPPALLPPSPGPSSASQAARGGTRAVGTLPWGGSAPQPWAGTGQGAAAISWPRPRLGSQQELVLQSSEDAQCSGLFWLQEGRAPRPLPLASAAASQRQDLAGVHITTEGCGCSVLRRRRARNVLFTTLQSLCSMEEQSHGTEGQISYRCCAGLIRATSVLQACRCA